MKIVSRFNNNRSAVTTFNTIEFFELVVTNHTDNKRKEEGTLRQRRWPRRGGISFHISTGSYGQKDVLIPINYSESKRGVEH